MTIGIDGLTNTMCDVTRDGDAQVVALKVELVVVKVTITMKDEHITSLEQKMKGLQTKLTMLP